MTVGGPSNGVIKYIERDTNRKEREERIVQVQGNSNNY